MIKKLKTGKWETIFFKDHTPQNNEWNTVKVVEAKI
jgi:hypothetical protein